MMVDIMNSDADPRALQCAQNAETQRMRHANHVRVEEENDRWRASRCIKPGVLERESVQQLEMREEPGAREHESAQRVVGRVEPGVRKHK